MIARPTMLVAALLLATAATAQQPVVAVTRDGELMSEPADGDGIVAFRGIPFAAPPVGERRWRPPASPAPWTGLRAATAFAPACMQTLTRSQLPWTEPYMHQGEINEDCLYLNVWTDSRATGNDRPVLVYVYGGGFASGSGSVEIYDGAALARKGVVVVTFNYRVGAFGFLAHPALRAESGSGSSGNYGLLDQIAALEWVQRNIDAFGGDPDRVTIAGQSAGAISVLLLTGSPLARGLFERAIVQSGPGALAAYGVASLDDLATPLQAAESAGRRFVAATELPAASPGPDASLPAGADADAAALAALRRVPADALLTAAAATGRFGPVVDGYVVPRPLARTYADGRFGAVPLIMGMMADEDSAFGASTAADVEERQNRRNRAITALQDIAGLYQSRNGMPVYLYYFARAIPWPEHPEYGAFHSGELPYTFANLDRLDRPWTAGDRRLADLASDYWISFVATGNPNGAGRPYWPDFAMAPRSVMRFDEQSEAKSMPPP